MHLRAYIFRLYGLLRLESYVEQLYLECFQGCDETATLSCVYDCAGIHTCSHISSTVGIDMACKSLVILHLLVSFLHFWVLASAREKGAGLPCALSSLRHACFFPWSRLSLAGSNGNITLASDWIVGVSGIPSLLFCVLPSYINPFLYLTSSRLHGGRLPLSTPSLSHGLTVRQVGR